MNTPTPNDSTSQNNNNLGFDENVILLIKVYGVSILSFVILFYITTRLTKHYLIKKKTSRYPPELTLIKYNVKLLWLICILLGILQIPLIQYAWKVPDKDSPFESLARPIVTYVFIGLGLAPHSHAIVRLIFAFCMIAMIIFDTVSEVILYEDTLCIERGGQTCSGRLSDIQDVKFYMNRDFLAIVTEIWSLLVVSYLSIALGCFTSRYSYKSIVSTKEHRPIHELIQEAYHL